MRAPLETLNEAEPEPLSYLEVRSPSCGLTWEDAAARELHRLNATNTFTSSFIPPGRRTISAEWVHQGNLESEWMSEESRNNTHCQNVFTKMRVGILRYFLQPVDEIGYSCFS